MEKSEKNKKYNGNQLIETAIEQLQYSYTPYSGFKVGAALLAKNGVIYTGCNIENAAYTPTNCAERTAFFKAVSEGVKEFEAICIVGGKEGIPHLICRSPQTFPVLRLMRSVKKVNHILCRSALREKPRSLMLP